MGQNDRGKVADSTANVAVTAQDHCKWIGGLAEANLEGSLMEASNSLGTLVCQQYVEGIGGLVGRNRTFVSNCYSTGDVTSGKKGTYLGGLIGDNYYGDGVKNCYTSGSTTSETASYYHGALIGRMSSSSSTSLASSYFLTPGNAGWPDNGVGTPFVGSLDGAGHTLSGLEIQSTGSYLGMIGWIEGEGVIRNVFLEDVLIAGGENSSGVGALAGVNMDLLSQVGCNGRIVGKSTCGGLIGYNGGSIVYAYAMGSVDTKRPTGGFVGTNAGVIYQAYSIASVNSHEGCHALVGLNSGCYVRCDGEEYEGDDDTARVLTSDQMMDRTNFTNWSFAGGE